MKSLLNIVAYDNLCSCLDLSHFVLRGREDVFEALPEHLAVCCGVHLKDGMYGESGVRPLGEGSCRAGELLAALKREGYDGRCSSKTVIRSRFSARMPCMRSGATPSMSVRLFCNGCCQFWL